VREIVLSLVASVIAGSAVWLVQWLLRYRRMARKRAFFGVSAGASCLLVAPRHFSSPQADSVHRRDMAALVELATIVNDCDGRTEVVTEDAGLRGIGRLTEFCVGGPAANARTAAHLRAVVPGVRFALDEDAGAAVTFRAGGTAYPASSEQAEYAVLVKAQVPATPNPVFIVAGQTARTNLAAGRLLASRYRSLLKTYGTSGRFCLVLKIVEPLAFGPDFVEIVADATADAFQASPRPPGGTGSAEPDRQPEDHRAE
jgi:hypothetical protein